MRSKKNKYNYGSPYKKAGVKPQTIESRRKIKAKLNKYQYYP